VNVHDAKQLNINSTLHTIRHSKLYRDLISHIPPPTLRNMWLTLCALVAFQNLIVFTNTQITGNAITALIVWGGALICMEDLLDSLQPKPSHSSLLVGSILVAYSLYRTSLVSGSDSLLYLLVPLSGLGLILMAQPFRDVAKFKASLFILCLLPLLVQIVFATFITDDLSLLTAKFVLFWLSILGLSPLKLIGDTVYVDGGAVQVMHECNGFEMIMQMLITGTIFLVAFPLRSRLGKLGIIVLSPIIGFIVNSIRIALLAIFTSFNSQAGKVLFDFFHEQAGSLIFSGIAVFLLGYLYLSLLDRELPPLVSK
jgi:cyanoexosortase A